MALTIDKLINDDRFTGDNVIHFLLYLPFGLMLLAVRTILGLVLWIAAIILPDKSSIRQLLSILACCTFGVYVKIKGKRDTRSSLLVANYVSALDSLAASHALGTISLRKWKVPPFFASTLGIRNAAQFARKQHFAECPSKPILLQPEGGPTNGKGLLKFTDWPFQLGNRVQPVAISVERWLTAAWVHGADGATQFPWWDVLWYLWTPVTVYTLRLLPARDLAPPHTHHALRNDIAQALQVEMTEFTWDELCAATSGAGGGRGRSRGRSAGAVAGAQGAAAGSQGGRASTLAQHVKEVLPHVPMQDILRDLARTHSVDVTITNFLEGVTPYTPETIPEPGPSTSQPQPKYITPLPTGVFPKNAKERQMSFKERKAEMIAEARRRYMEQHGIC